MSVKNRNSIVTDGLVFYVDAGNEDSYPGSGTKWSDLIGSDDATLSNGPTYSSSNGGHLVLDGTNDYINANVFTVPSNITICAWINPDHFGSVQSILSSDPSNSGTRNWQFRVEGSATVRAIGFHTSGSNNIQATTTATLTANTWTNVSMTSDGTNLKVYINAVEEATASFPYSLNGSGSSGDVLIGARYIASIRDFFDGKIAAAKVYDRGLTASEITQNYNALKNRFI